MRPDICRPSFVAELLIDIFHPPRPTRSPGRLDHCLARGEALAYCVRNRGAFPRGSSHYCVVARHVVPPSVDPLFVEDEFGTSVRVCSKRVCGWKTGPDMPNPRPTRPEASPKVRTWAENAVWSAAKRTDLIGATARAYTVGDWGGVDADRAIKPWLDRENERRTTTGNRPIQRDEICNEWRCEVQHRMFVSIARRAKREKPWK